MHLSGTKYSQQVLKLIDEEVKKILDASVTTATSILTDHRDHLELIAQSLLEYETLTGEEIDSLIQDGKINRIPPLELLEQEDATPTGPNVDSLAASSQDVAPS